MASLDFGVWYNNSSKKHDYFCTNSIYRFNVLMLKVMFIPYVGQGVLATKQDKVLVTFI